MVTKQISRLRPFVPASLVLVGWLSFGLGIGITGIPNALKLFLLSVARVLP